MCNTLIWFDNRFEQDMSDSNSKDTSQLFILQNHLNFAKKNGVICLHL